MENEKGNRDEECGGFNKKGVGKGGGGDQVLCPDRRAAGQFRPEAEIRRQNKKFGTLYSIQNQRELSATCTANPFDLGH